VQQELVELRNSSRTRLSEASEYLETSTREALLPKLARLQALISSSGEASNAIEGLKLLIKEDVRPLSESLSSQARYLVNQPQPDPIARKSYNFFQPKVQLKKLLRPNATFFTLCVFFWLLAYMIVSAPRCNDVAMASLGSWAIMWFAKLMIPVEARVSGRTSLVILASIASVAAVPPFLMGVSLSTTDSQRGLFGAFFAISIIAVMAFAYAEGLDLDRAHAREQLQRENEELAHDVALFEQKLWLGRRAWQFVVHGSVQAALTAALTRLQSAPSLDEETLDLIDQDLARARTALAEQPEREVDLDDSLAQIKSTWKGICKIETHISSGAQEELTESRDARLCVNEIVKECVSNGIRHGNAKHMTVEIDVRADSGLDIKVTNDGIPVKSKTQKGVGSRLIEELTTSWSIASDKATGLTVFEANLPLVR
jgi:signal transduction histidine kinase